MYFSPRNCSQVNVTEPIWWGAHIGSGDGLVPSGNKPLPEPMLTQTYVAIWRHYGPSSLNRYQMKYIFNKTLFTLKTFVNTFVANKCVNCCKSVALKNKGTKYRSAVFAWIIWWKFDCSLVNVFCYVREFRFTTIPYDTTHTPLKILDHCLEASWFITFFLKFGNKPLPELVWAYGHFN